METEKKPFKYVIRFVKKPDEIDPKILEYIEESPEIRLSLLIARLQSQLSKKN